jgi:hypothetical protein
VEPRRQNQVRPESAPPSASVRAREPTNGVKEQIKISTLARLSRAGRGAASLPGQALHKGKGGLFLEVMKPSADALVRANAGGPAVRPSGRPLQGTAGEWVQPMGTRGTNIATDAG